MKPTNPCRSCHIHFSGGNKNGQECIECKKRISYVLALGWDGVSHTHNVTDFKDINIRTPKSVPPPCVAETVSLPAETPAKAKRMINKGMACQELDRDGKTCGRKAVCKGKCWKHYSLMRYYKNFKAGKRGSYKKRKTPT